MEAIRQKLDEADDIAEVIDLMQNLSIQTKGCKKIEKHEGEDSRSSKLSKR